MNNYKNIEYLDGNGQNYRWRLWNTFVIKYKKSVRPSSKGHGLKRDHSLDQGKWVWLPDFETINPNVSFYLDDFGSSTCIIETEPGYNITTDKVDEVLTEFFRNEDVQKVFFKTVFNDEFFLKNVLAVLS